MPSRRIKVGIWANVADSAPKSVAMATSFKRSENECLYPGAVLRKSQGPRPPVIGLSPTDLPDKIFGKCNWTPGHLRWNFSDYMLVLCRKLHICTYDWKKNFRRPDPFWRPLLLQTAPQSGGARTALLPHVYRSWKFAKDRLDNWFSKRSFKITRIPSGIESRLCGGGSIGPPTYFFVTDGQKETWLLKSRLSACESRD